MDIGFDDERIGSLLLHGVGLESIRFIDNAMADCFDGAGLEQADVVANASPIEVDLFLPVTDLHDLPHGPMLFGEVLKFVVVEIASKPHGREHDDVPIVESFTPAIASRMFVDILGDTSENLIAKAGLAVDVLQAGQDWNDLVTTVEIEFDFRYRVTVETLLT